MELTVHERLVMQGLFAPQGDITYIRAMKDIIGKVGLSADEIAKYSVEQYIENGEPRLRWQLDVPQEKEIALTGGECALIVKELDRLNSAKQLTPEHLTLYEKFVER